MDMSKAKMENRALPKRFYLEAMAAPSGDSWAILLDGKAVKTPAKNPLLLRSKALADAIAAEWRAQQNVIDADAMPLTRLASIHRDRAATDRAAWITDLQRYAETDLVCYHAPDQELGRSQHAAFMPLIDWVAVTFGMEFVVTDGIMPIVQPASTLANVRVVLEQASDAELTALAMMIPLLGSVVIALAMWKERITVEQALKAARLDEDFHAKKWGEDAEAVASWSAKQNDIRAAAFFLTCN